MKRDEKNQKMRRKIMDSALTEFSNQGYGGSSINTICASQDISKGIIYHYFKTKDVLYLACVEECFQQLTQYIQNHIAYEDISIENIFAAGAAVLAGRQLGAKDRILFLELLMRAFGASDTSLPLAKDYAFWMFIAALVNLPAQSMNCAARAESSVKISSIAVITGALLNVILESIFMFDLGLNMGVEGASLATTVSQFVTFFIMTWFSLDVTW